MEILKGTEKRFVNNKRILQYLHIIDQNGEEHICLLFLNKLHSTISWILTTCFLVIYFRKFGIKAALLFKMIYKQ